MQSSLITTDSGQFKETKTFHVSSFCLSFCCGEGTSSSFTQVIRSYQLQGQVNKAALPLRDVYQIQYPQ